MGDLVPDMTLERGDVDLGELVAKVVERFREPARLSGSRIISQTEMVWVRCDPFSMEQAITNLITNAIRFGSGTQIEISAREDSGSALVLVRIAELRGGSILLRSEQGEGPLFEIRVPSMTRVRSRAYEV